jgi:hypothetical protein
MHVSRTDPTISAYKTINGPYNLGRYPLAPPGCKVIVYKAPAIRGSWASRGTNAWRLGPSPNHYQCNLYYIPATQAYCISGSAELFLQHCQVPNLTPKQHLHALTKELATTAPTATTTPKGRHLLKLLSQQFDNMLQPFAIAPGQRGTMATPEQRVTAKAATPIIPAPTGPLQRVTNAPAIMNPRDSTAKGNLILTKRTH